MQPCKVDWPSELDERQLLEQAELNAQIEDLARRMEPRLCPIPRSCEEGDCGCD